MCGVLESRNSTDAVKRLDEDERARLNLGGHIGETNIVNESGFYSVILRSDKPKAKAFRRCVVNYFMPRQCGIRAV